MSKTYTTIEFCIDGVSIVTTEDAILVKTTSFNFSAATEALKKEELIDFLKLNPITNDNLFLVVAGHKNALVPVPVFDVSKANTIFDFTFGGVSKDVDFCRIPEMSIVNVYEIPNWVKSLFVVRYPTLVLMHESTAVLKVLSHYKGLNTRMALVFHESYFSLTIYHLGNVMFQNCFVQHENSDVLYYTLHTMKQLDLAGRRANLFITTNSSKLTPKLNEIVLETKKIKEFAQLQIEVRENFISQYIASCE